MLKDKRNNFKKIHNFPCQMIFEGV